MTVTDRPFVLDLLASSALFATAPALAHGSAATSAPAESGWVQSAVHWVASCLPGGGSTGLSGAKAHAGQSGSTWWSSGAGSSDETSHYGSGSGSTGTGVTGTGAGGTGNTDGVAGSGDNAGFGGSLGAGDDGTTGGSGSNGSGSTGADNTGAGGAARSSTDVPEPGMLGLFAAGLIPLALRRRAMRKAAA